MTNAEENILLDLAPYTLLVLVGPSGCGKTTFAKALVDQLGGPQEAAWISSDELRSTLTGVNRGPGLDSRLEEVSESAFILLEAEVKAKTLFPANHKFVIVDTTGLNGDFRDRLFGLAQQAGYHADLVLFDYKTKADYTQGLEPDRMALTLRHVDRFRRDVLPGLHAKKWHKIHRIRQRNADLWADMPSLVRVNEADTQMLANACLDIPDGQAVTVIGDVHEGVQALDCLLQRVPATATLVFVGDLIDKGNGTREMVGYMTDLVQRRKVVLVEGNHEHYVAQALRSPEQAVPEEHLELFDSLRELKADAQLAEKFLALHAKMVPFVHVPGTAKRHTLYITHAPCREYELGKPRFVKAMRSWRPDAEQPLAAQLKPFLDEAARNKPIHVFGHFAHDFPRVVFKNKVFLDTGYTHGGRLTSFTYVAGQAFDIQHVSAIEVKPNASEKVSAKVLPRSWAAEQPEAEVLPAVSSYSMQPQDRRALASVLRGGAKYISGTMAPCPAAKGPEGSVLESLDAGLDYYSKAGVDRVILEPKYMGSRCQLYLRKGRLDECFAVSRNGFRIKNENVEGLSELLAHWLSKASVPGYLGNIAGYPAEWADELIIDGELLPWTALGSRLVAVDFRDYSACVKAELETLQEDAAFASLDFGKYVIDLDRQLGQLRTFDEQLEKYATDGPVHFKPFSVLSVDGVALTQAWPEDQRWATVSEDRALVISTDSPADREKAHEFFAELTLANGMEGVVIKPLVPKPEMAPYLKCRNEDYLTLVYGYNYKDRYVEMCSTKRTSGKLRLSIKEHALGQRMLKADEAEREVIACALLFEVQREKTLDPRL